MNGAKLIYKNKLSCEADVQGFRMEGQAKVSFPDGRMRLEAVLDPSEGQRSNFVYWCPEHFDSDIAITWNFRPLVEPGLAMLFFSAAGRQGEEVFDPRLAPRAGEYHQYHSSDMNAYHVSYFRRRYPEERSFHTCNLRKSCGGHLVCQGADPIPDVEDVQHDYRVMLTKQNGHIRFYINDLPIFHWIDNGETGGPVLGGGHIGFRQMAPLVAEYSELCVYAL